MMMDEGTKKQQQQSSCSSYCLYVAKCFPKSTSSSELSHKSSSPDNDEPVDPKHGQRKPGGWKAIAYILGTDTLERLATLGLVANFMVYLTRMLHLDQVSASNIINVWFGLSSFAPLLGAFISDAYVGRFRTILCASFASLLGMAMVTLTTWLPQLHPPPCSTQHQTSGQCRGPNRVQMGLFLLGLGLLSIGTGGIRPCSIPFGVDQFDPATDEGKKGVKSFFNWYYATYVVALSMTETVVVYIQDKISWSVGFGIPTLLMACSIVLLVIGSRVYVHAKPRGSLFSSVARVFVAAHKKRHIKLPQDSNEIDIDKFYDPPVKGLFASKLPLTNQIRFLNKSAFILDNDLKPDGSLVDNWRLCTVQQVEELKCVIKTIPVWASSLFSFTSLLQQGTFTVSQALKMDRHLGPHFEVPAGSLGIISFLTIGLWLPIYDRFLVPALRRITKDEDGITVLQRCGIGIVFSVLSMVVAGIVERERRAFTDLHPNGHVSFIWLAPQLILLGLCEAFSVIGTIEFFNREFPDHMRSIGNALFSCSFAGSSYLSSLVVNIVHHVTGTQNHPDWLTNDINAGRLDYFYFLLAGIGILNLAYFLYCANRYRYKATNVYAENKPYVNHEELGSTDA